MRLPGKRLRLFYEKVIWQPKNCGIKPKIRMLLKIITATQPFCQYIHHIHDFRK